MRISEQWLREWADADASVEAIAERLTLAGLEVGAVEPAAAEFSGISVAEVLAVDQHPHADKLSVCRVRQDEDSTVQVVCGASNVRPGLRVALARVGARLPGGVAIKKAKLRGVESTGMLCSAAELGLAENSEGILELSGDAPVGEDLRAALSLDDHILDIDLTPNRGDCLSVLGVAREVAALYGLPSPRPPSAETEEGHGAIPTIDVQAPEACPSYLGRIIQGVDASASTPLWMQERLRRSGQRSLGPLVDVTNYVMLELGQPMHAFDLAQVGDGGVTVRWADEGESLILLDGRTLALDSDVLVIASEHGPLAMAGVMGGQNSGVIDDTRDVLLECAFFTPAAVAGRARRVGLQTDSSHRFERGVDPQLQSAAMQRATRLLVEICGGTAGPIVAQTHPGHQPAHLSIRLRAERIERVLGVAMEAAEVRSALESLQMKVAEVSRTEWTVEPPSHRFDMEREVDLIEELARLRGYDRLPSLLPSSSAAMRSVSERQLGLRRFHTCLTDLGYQEIITYSFVDREQQRRLDPEVAPLALANPISSELEVMRTQLWPGLIAAAGYNLKRQQDNIRVFESGMTFVPDTGELQQTIRLGGLVCGGAAPAHWDVKGRPVDFFDLKGDLETLFQLTGAGEEFTLEPSSHPALHPGQSARVLRSGVPMGWLGLLHPDVRRAFELPDATLVFELDAQVLDQAAMPVYTALSRFPSIRRDIAVVVKEGVTVAQLRQCARAALGERLQSVTVFDVYRGKGIDSGLKSVAFGLILQDSSRTLTDQEVDAAIQSLLDLLHQELSAVLRD